MSRHVGADIQALRLLQVLWCEDWWCSGRMLRMACKRHLLADPLATLADQAATSASKDAAVLREGGARGVRQMQLRLLQMLILRLSTGQMPLKLRIVGNQRIQVL